MTKKIFLLSLLTSMSHTAFAVDLLEVYQQAVTSDPVYQQAIAQRLATKEAVPISVAALLPNVSGLGVPSLTRSTFSGKGASSPNTQRGYTLTLTATQTVFDFSQFAALAGARSVSKQADATLNAATQDLILRVANAYFTVLQDEDNLRYNEATKQSYSKQLDQVRQQYKVGVKTITDVYTAQASFDSSSADHIAAQTTLENDKENLRAITGQYYPHLAILSEKFPLISPEPASADQWVTTAARQNWSIKAAQYAVNAARQNIRQQYGGHFPTVSVQGTLDKLHNTLFITPGPGAVVDPGGVSTQTDRSVSLNINIPLFAGGEVIAQTNQATYNFQVSEQQLEQTFRNTANLTRQSYLNVISSIPKISADRQAIKSALSSMKGLEESYRVGTETLVNVLTQQQNVFQAQTQYAADRYAYVNNLLALKKAAGTLNFDDLRAINAWLMRTSDSEKKPAHLQTESS